VRRKRVRWVSRRRRSGRRRGGRRRSGGAGWEAERELNEMGNEKREDWACAHACALCECVCAWTGCVDGGVRTGVCVWTGWTGRGTSLILTYLQHDETD
jgi:hypothetical protein